MLRSLKLFFDRHLAADSGHVGQQGESQRLHLAAAALMIEMMKVDDELDDRERQIILRGLQSKFGLSAAQTQEILDLAAAEVSQATDYYQFTSLINKHFSPEQRVLLIDYLWQVAYADGLADKHEEHLVRKIAELIHVSHSDFIAAKQRAQKSAL